ncbi:GntR family transcriptional regulator [Adhaeretor mobilis]|uniref:HTH-type transcriptional repressor YvoA n=1 Tax=Adhaeretor mobilis TaxID=1930276 RepID=A0A517MZP6_9BACT|nr:GntR family transcriptional regulator [Adhaeretor mobilis]QDS98214.1 HTH-type transcriptional repressor YvoA [Adhaeretor mobilis]QDT00362.1 HTH-type transcriptional repressor YvoA [Adhaeretor mobilis]
MTATSSKVAYKSVADILRRRILANELKAGERLPTERELCGNFSASRITIRRALQILADETLIQRRHGSGTFVSPTPSRRIPILGTDFSGSVAAHAPELGRRLETWRWQSAPDNVATSLQMKSDGRVLFARRIDLLKDDPVAFDEVYLPEQVADQLDKQDLSDIRFLERWQKVQSIHIDYLTQSVEAIAAETAHRKRLKGKVGAPLLKEVSTMFLASGEACGLFTSYYRSDLFRLTSTFRLQSSSENGLE